MSSAPLKAELVTEKHAAAVAALEAFDAAFQDLMLLTPAAEEAADPKRPPRRMFTPDMLDSARAVARNLKIVRFDVLAVAQGVMNYTEEAQEAAIAAQRGKFKLVDDPAHAEGKEAPSAP